MLSNSLLSVYKESEVAQSCPTLFDLMDCSPPGSSVHGFSRQEYWSGLPFPSPGDLPDPGIEPRSPALEADTLTSEPPGKPPLEAVLVGINYLVFRKELIIEGSLPIPPYTQHHLLWMQTSLWYVCGGSFRFAHDPFHSTRFYSIHFSSPVTICFKNGTFSLL